MTARTVPDGPAARNEAAALLAAGGIAAIPTDTVYGLTAVRWDAAALARLLAVKGRPPDRGIAMLLADVEQAREVGEMTPLATILGRELWPGGLTLVVPARAGSRTTEVVLGPGRTVGIRVPDHPCPRRIAETVGPLPATSANPSGRADAADAAEIEERFGASINLIVDGGPAPGAAGSTVVDCTGEVPRLLRAGPIAAERVAAVLRAAGVGR